MEEGYLIEGITNKWERSGHFLINEDEKGREDNNWWDGKSREILKWKCWDGSLFFSLSLWTLSSNIFSGLFHQIFSILYPSPDKAQYSISRFTTFFHNIKDIINDSIAYGLWIVLDNSVFEYFIRQEKSFAPTKIDDWI